MSVKQALELFVVDNGFLAKGKLGVAIIVTSRLRHSSFPVDPTTLLTENGTRVSGLSGSAVRQVLRRHGEHRSLGPEVGRTSPQSPVHMRAYVQELNRLASSQPLDMDLVEAFWVDQVKRYFESQPLVLDTDPAIGVRGMVRRLVGMAEQRQRELAGTSIVGTVVQHLVGAKIEVALELPIGTVARHGANVNDQGGRGGDLELGDTVVHVTTAPSSALIEKCALNLAGGKRPIIVTGRNRLSAADAQLADNGLEDRVDVLDYEGFLAPNVFELGRFDAAGRRQTIERIVQRYNEVIDAVETDPSLKIEVQ